MHRSLEQRVIVRLIRESFASDLKSVFHGVLDTDDRAFEDGLEDANMSMRKWGNEPFSNADEMRKLEPDWFRSTLSGLKNWMANTSKAFSNNEDELTLVPGRPIHVLSVDDQKVGADNVA